VRGRRGLSEVLGAFIVIIAVVGASALVATTMSKATQRTVQALEEASSAQTLSVVPVAIGSELQVNVAPLEPGEQVTVIVADSKGKVLSKKTFEANSTVASVSVLDDYDCRPVYIVAITSEGRTGVFDRRLLGMPVNETIDPRLYTCPGPGGGVGAIRDPLTGARVLATTVTPAQATIDFKPVNETVQFRVGLTSFVKNFLGLDAAYVRARVYEYNGTAFDQIALLHVNEFVQVYQGRVNVSVGVLYDDLYDFAVIVAKIDGPSDLYLVNASVYARLGGTTRILSFPIGTPPFTGAPLAYALAQDMDMKLLNSKKRVYGGYVYAISGNSKGLAVIGDTFVVGYASFYNINITVRFTVRLEIIGEANYSVDWADHRDYYLGTVAPGDPIKVSLESLPFMIAKPSWQDSPASKLLEIAPIHPRTIQLVLEAADGKTKTVDVAFGDTTLVADDYYRVYLRIWEAPPLMIYSSWNISIIVNYIPSTSTHTKTWKGSTSQYPALNPTLPPWLITVQLPNSEHNIILGMSATPQEGAGAYLTTQPPKHACILPADPWNDPLVRWETRNCNTPTSDAKIVVATEARRLLTITLDGEELLAVPLYDIRILQAP